jgi:hypothetical protein
MTMFLIALFTMLSGESVLVTTHYSMTPRFKKKSGVGDPFVFAM